MKLMYERVSFVKKACHVEYECGENGHCSKPKVQMQNTKQEQSKQGPVRKLKAVSDATEECASTYFYVKRHFKKFFDTFLNIDHSLLMAYSQSEIQVKAFLATWFLRRIFFF